MLIGLAVVLILTPISAKAQPQDQERRLGVLMGYAADDPQAQLVASNLVRGLDALGWREGRNLRIEWRWADADPVLVKRYAAELVALGPDVLVTGNSSTAVDALRRVTTKIPVVFAMITDPAGQGFVESLSHPGGNVTGFSNYDQLIAGKWLELLTQITPAANKVMVLYNPTTAPYAGLYLDAIENAGKLLHLSARPSPVSDVTEVEAAMAALAREQHGGVLVLPDIFNGSHRGAIVGAAARYGLPAVYPFRPYVASGGLMSYGVDQGALYQRAGGYVDAILKGKNPADLPVQQPTKFELVINLKTANALGITVPQSLLQRADEVIE